MKDPDLRTRIAAALKATDAPGAAVTYEQLADAVIAELGSIPDRQFTDDQGRTWEWCGGQPETWAWRITRMESRR